MKVIFRSAGALLTKSKKVNLNVVAMAATYVVVVVKLYFNSPDAQALLPSRCGR